MPSSTEPAKSKETSPNAGETPKDPKSLFRQHLTKFRSIEFNNCSDRMSVYVKRSMNTQYQLNGLTLKRILLNSKKILCFWKLRNIPGYASIYRSRSEVRRSSMMLIGSKPFSPLISISWTILESSIHRLIGRLRLPKFGMTKL